MRFAIAVASTLTLLLAAPASAAPRSAARAPAPAPAASTNSEPGFYIDQIAVSGWIGGEFGDLDGVYLRADGAVPIWNPLPQLQLLGVASLGFTHLGDSNSYYEISWNMVRVVASARGQWTFNEQWDVFADLGLGFYFGGWSSELDTGLGTYEADDTTGGGTMRVAAGGHFAINEQMKVGAEMGYNPYWGDADTTNFFMGVGFQYAF